MDAGPGRPFTEAGVVELRQYTLRPGALPELLDVFETELLEPQEEAGMRIGGLFEDLEDPDRFVWMRGFDDMESRRRALEEFYGGPVWGRHADRANATMLDSDDVLLLRPTAPPHPAGSPASATAGPGRRRERVLVTTWLHEPDPALEHWLSTTVHEALCTGLETEVATWRTEPAANTFPRLPVRLDHAFVWLASFPDDAALRAAEARCAARPAWRHEVAPRLAAAVTSSRRLHLRPTARSRHPCPRPVR